MVIQQKMVKGGNEKMTDDGKPLNGLGIAKEEIAMARSFDDDNKIKEDFRPITEIMLK